MVKHHIRHVAGSANRIEWWMLSGLKIELSVLSTFSSPRAFHICTTLWFNRGDFEWETAENWPIRSISLFSKNSLKIKIEILNFRRANQNASYKTKNVFGYVLSLSAYTRKMVEIDKNKMHNLFGIEYLYQNIKNLRCATEKINIEQTTIRFFSALIISETFLILDNDRDHVWDAIIYLSSVESDITTKSLYPRSPCFPASAYL